MNEQFQGLKHSKAITFTIEKQTKQTEHQQNIKAMDQFSSGIK